MGGGDLNLKKSWHPKTFANQEKLWKAEEKAAREKQQLEQLLKEKERERAIQELEKQREDSGQSSKRHEKLDWMYAGSAQASVAIQEEYLLGKRRIDPSTINLAPVPLVDRIPQARPAAGLMTTNFDVDRDTEAKLREDPLYAIRKREEQMRKVLKNNPVKMRQLMSQRTGTMVRHAANAPLTPLIVPENLSRPRSPSKHDDRRHADRNHHHTHEMKSSKSHRVDSDHRHSGNGGHSRSYHRSRSRSMERRRESPSHHMSDDDFASLPLRRSSTQVEDDRPLWQSLPGNNDLRMAKAVSKSLASPLPPKLREGLRARNTTSVLPVDEALKHVEERAAALLDEWMEKAKQL